MFKGSGGKPMMGGGKGILVAFSRVAVWLGNHEKHRIRKNTKTKMKPFAISTHPITPKSAFVWKIDKYPRVGQQVQFDHPGLFPSWLQ